MIKFDDQEITEDLYNITIEGQSKNYSFYKHFTGTSKIHVTGKNCICLGATVNLDENGKQYRKITHLEYHEDVKSYLDNDEDKLTDVLESMFKSVKDSSEAEEIIEDIKNNPNNKFM